MNRITKEMKDFVKSKILFNEPGVVTLQNSRVAVLLRS